MRQRWIQVLDATLIFGLVQFWFKLDEAVYWNRGTSIVVPINAQPVRFAIAVPGVEQSATAGAMVMQVVGPHSSRSHIDDIARRLARMLYTLALATHTPVSPRFESDFVEATATEIRSHAVPPTLAQQESLHGRTAQGYVARGDGKADQRQFAAGPTLEQSAKLRLNRETKVEAVRQRDGHEAAERYVRTLELSRYVNLPPCPSLLPLATRSSSATATLLSLDMGYTIAGQRKASQERTPVAVGMRVVLREPTKLKSGHLGALHKYAGTEAEILEVPQPPNAWFRIKLHDGRVVVARRGS